MTDKEVQKLRFKEYYQNNKDKWLRKIHCKCCNMEITKSSMPRHIKTRNHLAAMQRPEYNTNEKIDELTKQLNELKSRLE